MGSFKKYREISKKLRDLEQYDDASAYRLKNERNRMRRKFLKKYGFRFLCIVAALIIFWCITVSVLGI
jgi:hypothetical protein